MLYIRNEIGCGKKKVKKKIKIEKFEKIEKTKKMAEVRHMTLRLVKI